MKSHSVQIIRLAGTNPVTKQPITRQEETLTIQATSEAEARQKGRRSTTIQFMGADMEVYVNGKLALGNF